jgi:hypothetical protein
MKTTLILIIVFGLGIWFGINIQKGFFEKIAPKRIALSVDVKTLDGRNAAETFVKKTLNKQIGTPKDFCTVEIVDTNRYWVRGRTEARWGKVVPYNAIALYDTTDCKWKLEKLVFYSRIDTIAFLVPYFNPTLDPWMIAMK